MMKPFLRKLFLWFALLFCAFPLSAQVVNPFMKEVFALINAARTNPKQFLLDHKAEIEAKDTAYAAFLKTTPRLYPVRWDEGLYVMARRRVEMKEMAPKYEGKYLNCGNTMEYRLVTKPLDPLGVVISFRKEVHERNVDFFGSHINYHDTESAYVWSRSCSEPTIPFTYNGLVDSSAVDFNKINTGKNATYLSEEGKRMVLEVNLLRAYPKVYAQIVGRYMHDKSANDGGLDPKVHAATVELIAELEKLEPVGILQPQQCLYYTLTKHAVYCRGRGFYEAENEFSRGPLDRMKNYCQEIEAGIETARADTTLIPRSPLISILIDYRSQDRPSRRELLDPRWKMIGVLHYLEKETPYFKQYFWIMNMGF